MGSWAGELPLSGDAGADPDGDTVVCAASADRPSWEEDSAECALLSSLAVGEVVSGPPLLGLVGAVGSASVSISSESKDSSRSSSFRASSGERTGNVREWRRPTP